MDLTLSLALSIRTCTPMPAPTRNDQVVAVTSFHGELDSLTAEPNVTAVVSVSNKYTVACSSAARVPSFSLAKSC